MPCRIRSLFLAMAMAASAIQINTDSQGRFQSVPREQAREGDTSFSTELFNVPGGRVSGNWRDHEDVPDEDIDAWLFCPRESACAARAIAGAGALAMFSPLLITMQDALAGVGANTRVALGTHEASQRMLQGIRAAAAKGRQPLLLGLGVFWTDDGGEEAANRIMKGGSEAGAYLVVYQTEQGTGEVKHHLKLSGELSAKEMWDFSMHQVRTAQSLNSNASFIAQYMPPGYIPANFIFRYMPPGYSHEFEVGVDLASQKRQEGSIGFMGTLKSRPPEIREKYTEVLGPLLNETKHVWTRDELREWCNALPLQLNVHQHSGTDVGLEAFRLAPLLSNKACVISAPVPEEDMALWDGIVRFADADGTVAKMTEARSALRECQEQSYEKFKMAFDPVRLLKSSGFLKAWQPSSKS